MITTTRILTRTDNRLDGEQPWHLDEPFRSAILTQEYLDHVGSTYAGKQTNQAWTRSEDSLTLTFTSSWNSVEDYQTYMNDPICIAMFARRDAHNAQFGIISGPTTTTET